MRRSLLIGLVVGASLLAIPRLARGEAWYYEWWCTGECSPGQLTISGTEGPFETREECERVKGEDPRDDYFIAPGNFGGLSSCENREGQPGYRPAPAARPVGGYVPVGERPPEPPPKISKVDVGLLVGAPYRVETMSGVETATGVTTGVDLRIQTGTKPEIGGELVVGLQYSRVSTAHYADDRSMVFVPWLIGLTSTPRLYRGKREVRLDLAFDVGGLSRVGCGDCAAEGLPTHAFLMVARGGFDVYSGATLDSGWGVDAVMQWSRHGDTGADPAAIAVVSPALLVRLSFGGKVRETGATW